MGNSAYYEDLKALAREKRQLYGVQTAMFGLREVRAIYRAEKIRIDIWEHLPKSLKALYMCDDGFCSVALRKDLPDEPKLFALVHELKHHYRDRAALAAGIISASGDWNVGDPVEVGAEVFAAEFIYPEAECLADFQAANVAAWTPQALVAFKRHCGAKVSYKFLVKRLEWFGLIDKGAFNSVQFKKLEEQIYGVPFYKRRYRQAAGVRS
jgi:Zn-dependent peptidase ImmA (M78 family)